MIQPAVGHQEDVATRYLAIDDAGHVHASVRHQIAPELDHQPGLRQPSTRIGGNGAQVLHHRQQIERLVAGKVRHAEAATEIQHSHRAWRVFGQAHGQVQRLALSVANGLGLEILRAAIDMEAAELDRNVEGAHRMLVVRGMQFDGVAPDEYQQFSSNAQRAGFMRKAPDLSRLIERLN